MTAGTGDTPPTVIRMVVVCRYLFKYLKFEVKTDYKSLFTIKGLERLDHLCDKPIKYLIDFNHCGVSDLQAV